MFIEAWNMFTYANIIMTTPCIISPALRPTAIEPPKPSDVAKSDVWRRSSTHRKIVQQDDRRTRASLGRDGPAYPNLDGLDWKFLQFLKNVRGERKKEREKTRDVFKLWLVA